MSLTHQCTSYYSTFQLKLHFYMCWLFFNICTLKVCDNSWAHCLQAGQFLGVWTWMQISTHLHQTSITNHPWTAHIIISHSSQSHVNTHEYISFLLSLIWRCVHTCSLPTIHWFFKATLVRFSCSILFLLRKSWWAKCTLVKESIPWWNVTYHYET